MDQQASARASAKWMEERQNKRSHFWQFIEQMDPPRRRIAWTNICKMDRVGGKRPPSNSEFAQVADPCMRALNEEIVALAPQVTVFATSGLYNDHVQGLLARIGYEPSPLQFDDGWTSCARSSEGRFAVMTKHSQGWIKDGRQRVIELLMVLVKAAA
ncbi:MAG TPA: uracil-DNA glycosylase family protein [Tepidisphaeraceae bacterium]|nr:uracil-DNA glycosylase family protein [Tepidisphaeraceae bacterium]